MGKDRCQLFRAGICGEGVLMARRSVGRLWRRWALRRAWRAGRRGEARKVARVGLEEEGAGFPVGCVVEWLVKPSVG